MARHERVRIPLVVPFFGRCRIACARLGSFLSYELYISDVRLTPRIGLLFNPLKASRLSWTFDLPPVAKILLTRQSRYTESAATTPGFGFSSSPSARAGGSRRAPSVILALLQRGSAQRTMRAHGDVVDAPARDRLRRVDEIHKPLFVQALVPKPVE